jgi:hypothetical protein
MFRNILVALHGAARAERVFETALELFVRYAPLSPASTQCRSCRMFRPGFVRSAYRDAKVRAAGKH